MSKPEHWASLAETEMQLRKEAAQTNKWLEQDLARKLDRVTSLRLAVQLVPELQGTSEGYSKYSTSATLHLGHFKSNQKAILGAKLRELRRRFGCALISEGWELDEKRGNAVRFNKPVPVLLG